MGDVSRFRRTAAAATALLLVSSISGSGLPPLVAAPQDAGGIATVVQVSSEPDLQSAVAALASGTTIVLAPGTYRLTGTLTIKGALTNVGITGSTQNPDDVVLVGMGMTNPDYGAVPHGISVGGHVQGITISNLTIRDVFQHAISLEAGVGAPQLYNLRLVDAGRQFVKAYPDRRGGGVDEGIVEGSVMEYSFEAPGTDTGAVHVSGGARWVVRGNRFRNIRAPAGGLAAPAVLMAQGARDSLIERNTFVNCQREIALGVEDRTPSDHAGGIVRNNFITRDFATHGGPAIQLIDSPAAQVLHNTILSNTGSASLIEYRLGDTTGVVVRNNLLDGHITARHGVGGAGTDNYLWAVPGMFAAPASGDLHLLATAAEVIDRAPALADASADIDGDLRPQGNGVDYGADEAPAMGGAESTTEPSTSASSSAPYATTTMHSSSASALPVLESNGLPDPWAWADVGSPQRAGSADWASGTFTVNAAGADIGANADQFTFVYQTLDGDGEIVARVADLERTHPWAKAGLMIRDELTAKAKYAGAFVTAEKGSYLQYRLATGSNTTQVSGESGKAPQWLRLSRKGQTFTAAVSADGVNWTTIGSEAVYLNRLAFAGLAVTSRSWRVSTTASFTDTEVSTAAGTNQPPEVTLTSPTHGASFNTPCSIDLTAAASDSDGSVKKVDFYAGSTLIASASQAPYTVMWSNVPPGVHKLKAVVEDDRGARSSSPEVEVDVADNQAPAVSLTAPAAGTSYTAPASIALAASASDADGSITRVDFFAGSTSIGSDTTSPYTATWTNVPAGSYTLTAVARDNDGAATWSAPSSVIVVEPANLPPVVSLAEPGAGSRFETGSVIPMSASASDADGTIAKVEFYAGAMLVGSDTASPYEIGWTAAGAGTYTLSAKAWDNAGASTISAGVNVTVEAASSLPSPWQTADIGSPAVAGSAGYTTGGFTVVGAGEGIGGASDQFRFVHQPLEGDGAIVACVESLDFVDAWSKAGVMIRETLDASAPYALTLLSAGWGAAFHHRAAAGQEAGENEPVPAVAPHCVRLVRRGSSFTAYQAVDGTAWSPMGTATISMSPQVYVGLAVTSHKADAAAEAIFEDVAVTAAPPNEPPTVTLTAPGAGASFTAPATITLTASASDPDGSIAGVDFHVGATLVGSDLTSPYSVTWSVSTAGTYTLTAVARDDSGATASSAPVSITVAAPADPAPRYAVFNASGNHEYVSSYRVEFFAAGQNPDTATPVTTLNAGKPAPVNGEITVDITATVAGFAPGTYFATVTAINSAGSSRSEPSATFIVE